MAALIYKTTKEIARELYYRIIASAHSIREG